MDRKFESLGSRLQLDPNNNLPQNAKSPSSETSPTDKVEPTGKAVKKTNSSNSATSSTGSINTSSISTTSSTSSSSCTTQQSQFSIFATNHVPRKTSKSDSSTNQLPSAFKLKSSPEPNRKFSLSTLTSNAADRLMQRKSSLQQPQSYHQLPHQAVLPNFMGLFLAEDQQQLISSGEQTSAAAPPTSVAAAAKPTGKPESIISNYLQRKASRTGQPTSSITNLATGAAVFATCSPQPGSKKKYSEPLLPGLLREEFFLTQCLGGALDETNPNLSALANESNSNLTGEPAKDAETGELPPQKSPSHFTAVEFDMIPTIVPHLVSSTISASAAPNGRRRTTLSSLIATNRPIGTVTGFRLNNSILEQQTLDTKNTLFPSQHHESHSTHQLSSMANNLYNQSNFLHYLPFRRFSKRAQSDGSIGERLVHRFTYSGNRRFTLGTTTDNLFQAEGEVSICF